MVNRSRFYKIVREHFGKLRQEQVDGFELFLDLFDANPETLTSQLAYILATAWHETAATMQPVVEYGGRKYFDKYDTGKLAARLGNTPEKDGDGFLLRGRGFVQITGHDNYERLGKEIGEDLLSDPDKTLEPAIALKIIWIGMHKGLFTGKKLSDYLTPTKKAYLGARYIVNVQDAAKLIASYARVFERALTN